MLNQTEAAYTVKVAQEFGAGKGPNGTGKRAVVYGVYVMRGDRRVRAFGGVSKRTWEANQTTYLAEAIAHAKRMNEAKASGERWAQ